MYLYRRESCTWPQPSFSHTVLPSSYANKTLPFNASWRNSKAHSNSVELSWILSCTFFPLIFWRNNVVISSQYKKDPWSTKWGFLNFHNLDSITATERDNETFFPSLFSPTCSQAIFFQFFFLFCWIYLSSHNSAVQLREHNLGFQSELLELYHVLYELTGLLEHYGLLQDQTSSTWHLAFCKSHLSWNLPIAQPFQQWSWENLIWEYEFKSQRKVSLQQLICYRLTIRFSALPRFETAACTNSVGYIAVCKIYARGKGFKSHLHGSLITRVVKYIAVRLYFRSIFSRE